MSSKTFDSDFVWIAPTLSKDEFSIPIGCRIIRTDKNKLLVHDDDGREYWIKSGDIIKSMHITSQNGVEDMITLGDLQEYAILRNLHLRYNSKKIYTYTGAMLIAINPYEILPIYTNREIKLYRNQKIGALPPHIFAIGDSAFQQMQNDLCNQCIVISGESGAGKTESTKILLQYLAAASGKHSWIEQQIIEANPIMEAFGNAKTVRNDNSSRFGKYIDIQFSADEGVILGAKIEQYLLEKSRIVSQNKNERNYHIFYSLLAGLSRDEKKKLELEEASKYYYLKQGDCLVCEGRNDAAEFADIRSAMQVLSFSDDEVWNIFCLLAAILHLGNLKIHAVTVQNIDSAEINDTVNLTKISNLLKIDKQSFCLALTKRSILAQGEKVVTSLSKDASLEGRDAFVKALYGRIFVRIIERINQTINKSQSSSLSIGVLDIFGFENFDLNSFEQLCINYANENLQQFFVRHIFKMEQDEYSSEGINWQHIEFIDNQEILNMIGQKPMNIMSLIDEESKFPRGTDGSLLEKLHVSHGNKSTYTKPKSSHITQFGIRHYAGVVYYNPNGFLEKNRDSFSLDLKEMIANSSNKFLVGLFDSDALTDTSKKSVTLSVQFRNSLDTLMKTLFACHPFFIRCIKPNETKQANKFDKSLCVRQLRYSGIMETAKIRKAGYPIRHNYAEFVQRYRHLVPGLGSFQLDTHEAAKRICEKILPSTSDYQLGHTKVFLKDSDDAFLESERERIHLKYILIIQRGFRRVIFKKWLNRYKQAAITIQKIWRGHGPRKKFLHMRKGFHRLQACIVSRQLVARFKQTRFIMIRLQSQCRGYLARSKLKKLKEFAMIRSKEEKELQKAGKPNWKEIARENYVKRMENFAKDISSLSSNAQKEYQRNQSISEDENKVLEKIFDFLNMSSPSESPTPPPSITDEDHHHNNQSLPKGGTIRLPQSKKYSEDLSEFNFEKYAATYFTGNVTYKYSKRPLKDSLLEHVFPMDKISAQAVWITILRFMGDMAEAKFDNNDSDDDIENKTTDSDGNGKNPKRIPVMHNLTATLSKSFKMDKELLNALKNETEHQKLVRKTLKRKSKLPDILKGSDYNYYNVEYYEKWLNTRSSSLDKLHFIIGHGILRSELRDEIFCQICKQLNDNPYYISFAKGWILLSLCLGCFSPSSGFEKYLRNFIRKGPELYSPYCEERLERTLNNGQRTQPPSWLELQATRNKAPITLNVILMDGEIKKLQIDSASTSQEAVNQLAKNMKLRDSFGFSVVITLFDKIISLGCGREHIMDAISNCEQYTKEQGYNDRKAFWKLYLRKEIFSPWYDPSLDELATNLIYKQIVRGINFGEYRCKKDIDIAIISALQYYAENGAQMDRNLLRKILPDYIPKDLLTSREEALNKWEKLVVESFERCEYVRKQSERKRAKEDIVIFAKTNWSMMFSRFFEAVRIDGPKLNTDNIIIAVNWKGVYFIDENEEILTEFDYIEITSVSVEEDELSNIDELLFDTIQKDNFRFKCYDAKDISDLINYLLENLKKYSTYAVALQDYQSLLSDVETGNYLQFFKGDVIRLDENDSKKIITKTEKINRWLYGECHGLKGSFPSEMVYVLPTITEPSEKILKYFKEYSNGTIVKRKKYQRTDFNTLQKQKLHTLRKFAAEHFRSKIAITTTSQTIHVARMKTEDLWRHSPDPIKAPLLKKLQNEKHLFEHAVAIFVCILKYMGDLPRGRASVNTDHIFRAAIKNENLRDEVYCQIMKQLTDNRIQLSEERGWDLMWLATGVLYPSSSVMKELLEFLRTRSDYHPLATESLKRVQKLISLGSRKHPPYTIEVDAIQNRAVQIFHKIYFPDETDEAFEIQSMTRCQDLIETIAKRLNLKTTDGFALFITVQDKAFSIPNDDYLFDFITEILIWMRKTMPFRQASAATSNQNNNIQFQYQLLFMKKLWTNTIVPGKDINADVIFYYPQEIRKYLNGYYKVTKTDAVQIAAFIFKAEFDANGNNSQIIFQKIDDILMKLIPKDVIPLRKFSEWKRDILNKFEIICGTNNNAEITQNDGKIEFLKEITKQTTFGSTFFIVEQSNDVNLPKIIMIAINRNGFHILDPMTKDILMSYEYTELNFWSSGNTFFHIRFGNMIGASKLLCITTQGYKIDDLISSYIQYLYPKQSK